MNEIHKHVLREDHTEVISGPLSWMFKRRAQMISTPFFSLKSVCNLTDGCVNSVGSTGSLIHIKDYFKGMTELAVHHE